MTAYSGAITDGTISSAYTEFFVDHNEPLEALEWVRENGHWSLGGLLDGYGFLLIVKAKPNSRARSRPHPAGSRILRRPHLSPPPL